MPQVAHVRTIPELRVSTFFVGRYSGWLNEKQLGHCAAFDTNSKVVRFTFSVMSVEMREEGTALEGIKVRGIPGGTLKSFSRPYWLLRGGHQ